MMKKSIYSRRRIYLCIILLYIVVVFIANWSLLIGENIMKWDIAEAHYPYEVFMGDAIKNGQLPLWNPMVQYGTPQYAIAGMPVWYPISIILGLIGYSPYMMGFEYSIHMVLAGFGMFLLIKSYSADYNRHLWSILSGILYMFSTVFISNAQHIMIIISATWIPYVMLNIKKYLNTKKKKNLFLSGGFAALIVLGGYPEILAATFLCLIPYILIENYKLKENQRFRLIAIDSFKIFIMLCLCTITGGAITLVPFIHSMLYITRGVNASVAVQPVSITALITSMIPGTSNVLPLQGDVSMIYSYVGIITIITLFVMFYINRNRYISYLWIALFAFIMNEGTSFFLYTFFHRFVPLFSSFRFPSTWRCLVVVFLLIPCSMVWNEIEKDEVSNIFIKISTIMGSCLIILGAAVLLASYIIKDIVPNGKVVYLAAATSIAGFLTIIYIPVLVKIRNEKLICKKCGIMLISVCIIEVLTFQFCEFPTTIGTFKQGNYDVQYIKSFNNQYKYRNKNFEFKDSKRTNTIKTANNRDIILNHDMDESGYMSFRLSKTEMYENSTNRLIMSQNPAVFFTNNVVTNEQIDLKQWLENANSPSAQIYVNKSLHINKSDIKDNVGEMKNVKISKVKYEKQKDNSYRVVNLNITDNRYVVRKLKIYTKDNEGTIHNTNEFFSNKGETILKTQGISSNKLIEVYLPLGGLNSPWVDISSININFDRPTEIETIEYIEGERITKDNDINIETYNLNNLRINACAKTEGYVVVQQANYPGWNVYLNGKKADIETINGVFMGVKVPQGYSEIDFKFLPVDFIIGAFISGMYFICIIFLFINGKSKGKIR